MVISQAVIDSNVLVAAIDSCDKWHPAAKSLVGALQAGQVNLIYLDCVLNETISVLARRTSEQKRPDEFVALLDELMQQVPVDVITWLSPETERMYQEIVTLVRQTLGELNFHDALMALFCRNVGIGFIISFDRDFDRIAWLTRVKNPADVILTKQSQIGE